MKSAEAALELARLQLSYTVIRAPADGNVSRLSARAGQIVQPGQVLGQLVPSRTYVVANFKETQTGAIRPGQDVDIDVDAYSDIGISEGIDGRASSLDTGVRAAGAHGGATAAAGALVGGAAAWGAGLGAVVAHLERRAAASHPQDGTRRIGRAAAKPERAALPLPE